MSMQSTRTLRLAFIGGGINSAVGNVHRAASQLDGRWKLVCGVFSSRDEINSRSAFTYGLTQKNACRNIDELIERREEFDAVSVLSPTNLHFEHISKLIKENIQVISEKAVVSNISDGLILLEEEEKKDKEIFVTFNYTAYPMVRELKSRIENNAIGDIQFIHIEMPQEGFLKLNEKLAPPSVQIWRTVDGALSTLSLDLGVHTQNLIHFISGSRGKRYIGIKSHRGLITKTVDYISALGNYENDIDVSIWYGKTALGHRNGLRLRVFGEHGSFEWEQIFPDRLIYANQTGAREIIDPGSSGLVEAGKSRYMRFKPGHPTGFLEAFANYYYDLSNIISVPGSQSESKDYVFSSKSAINGLREIQAIEKSCETKVWEEVQ